MMGIFASVPVSLTSLNVGDSSIFMRITKPTATSTIENRNGIRQPHERNDSSDITFDTMRTAMLPSSSPPGTPIWGHEP
jgi:hypothetical protein